MPKKVKFPIHITEVYQGIESDKTLDIGEIVQCLGCGQEIAAASFTSLENAAWFKEILEEMFSERAET